MFTTLKQVLRSTNPDEATTAKLKELRDAADKQLNTSDNIQTGDLLRFDKDSGLKPIDIGSISYKRIL